MEDCVGYLALQNTQRPIETTKLLALLFLLEQAFNHSDVVLAPPLKLPNSFSHKRVDSLAK